MINDPTNLEPVEEKVDAVDKVEEPPKEEQIKEAIVEDQEVEKIVEKEEPLFEMEEPPKKMTAKQKQKRKATEAQLANLKKAREKSVAKRKELKEARELEKATKKLERDAKKEALLQKKMENEAVLEMKAKLLKDAEKSATWDEDRITALMEKTLDNYIAKRKKEKAPTTRQPLVQPQPQTQPLQNYAQPPQPYYPQQTRQMPNNNRHNFEENPFARFMG